MMGTDNNGNNCNNGNGFGWGGGFGGNGGGYIASAATQADIQRGFDTSTIIGKLDGINNLDAYVDFAKALWLDDEDAVKDKLASYYSAVVRH